MFIFICGNSMVLILTPKHTYGAAVMFERNVVVINTIKLSPIRM